MHLLRAIGINLLGARNTSLRALGRELLAPIAAEKLGCS